MTDQRIFFDHWFIALKKFPQGILLNGTYEEFLKSHAKHFQSRGIFDEEDTNDSTR